MTLQKSRTYMFLAVAALMLLSCSAPAYAVFEKYNLYGVSAGGLSLGSPVVPSSNDVFGFISNPASLRDTSASAYVFSLGSLNTDMDGAENYKYTIAGMVRGPRSAWTIGKFKDDGFNRTIVTYSYCARPSEKSPFYYGINVNGFSYKAVEGNASGFSGDFGVIYAMSERVKAGLTLKNFITTTGKEKESGSSDTERSLSSVMGIGVLYKYNKDIEMNLSYNTYKTAEKNIGPNESKSFKTINLGVEYSLPSKITVRAAGGSNDYLDNGTDKMAFAGFGYRTDKYDFSAALLNRNNVYDSGSSVTLAYKTSGKWNVPLPERTPATATAATATAATPTVAFEPPLPAVNEKKDEPPKIELAANVVSDFGLPDDDSYDSSKPVSEIVSNPLDIQDAAITPKAILIPAYTKSNFTDTAGTWADEYVKDLSSKGFFPSESGTEFKPAALVSREEFYRLVFLSQLERMFGKPVTVLFSTDEPVRAVVTLDSPSLNTPIRLTSGSYKASGDKRLLIDRDTFVERGVMPGRYKIRVHLSTEGKADGDIEEYITVLDTSFDFSELSGMQGEAREAKAKEIADKLNAMGMDAGYVYSISQSGDVSRLEALGAVFTSMGFKPTETGKDYKAFDDIANLNAKESGAIAAASKPLAPIGNRPLMGGYPGGTFKPEKPMTRAEAAAIIARSLKITAVDLGSSIGNVAAMPVNNDVIAAKPVVAAPVKKPSSTDAIGDKPVQKAAKPRKIDVKKNAPVSKPVEKSPQYAASVSTIKYLVVAKSCVYKENADSAAMSLAKKGYKATVVEQAIGNSKVFDVVLGSYDSAGSAEEAASAVIAGYDLKVKKVNLDAPAINVLPGKVKIESKPDENEREVRMRWSSTSANETQKSEKTDIYIIQSQ